MSKRTKIGRDVEKALGEVLDHVKGKKALDSYDIETADPSGIVAIRTRMGLSRARFAKRFGLDPRAVQEWEQGRRRPDRTARVLLAVIDKAPKAVIKALEQ